MAKDVSFDGVLDTAFLDAVWHGLSLPQKSIPSSYLYDARGSALFERITTLREYYPTRTELGLLKDHGAEIGALIPPRASVVEFGSGSSRKTELLLRALDRPRAYMPIDISASALFPAAERIRNAFPDLDVHPVVADFEDMNNLTLSAAFNKRLGFFPGSTIGNLTSDAAVNFLLKSRVTLGNGAHFLLGADLKKSLNILIPAYDDRLGVTAAFNLNILTRINRELEGSFDSSLFRHEVRYVAKHGRIEMHLRATKALTVSVAGREFSFSEGETIHTENSHKYELADIAGMAERSGWSVTHSWTDRDRLFSLNLLAVKEALVT